MRYIIMFLLVWFGFSVWLDYGCKYNGILTWEGKVCFEDLFPGILPQNIEEIVVPTNLLLPCEVENCKG